MENQLLKEIMQEEDEDYQQENEEHSPEEEKPSPEQKIKKERREKP